MTASTPPFDALTGWRYPRTRPSLRRKMGEFANGRLLSAAAWSVAAVIAGLNGWLLVGTVGPWMG